MNFTDRNGDAYRIDLTPALSVGIMKASERKWNLMDPSHRLPDGRDQFSALLDPLEAWELLAYMVAPQLEKQGKTPAEFGEAMAADCLVTARDAFFGEWAKLFRGLGRNDGAMAVEKCQQFLQKAVERLTAEIDSPRMKQISSGVTAKIERDIDAVFESVLKDLES